MTDQLEYFSLDKNVTEYLEKVFSTPLRSGYITCKGFVLPKTFKNAGGIIKNLDVRDDDIWVCSFPKTGTTWAQEMIWCIGNDLDFETAAEKFLYLRFPFLEYSILHDADGEIFKKKPEIKEKISYTESFEMVNNHQSPRFIKTHLPFSLLPEKLQNNTTKAKIIYVTRNPRDTCISYYHHCRLMEGYDVTFETFCDLFLKGQVCYSPFEKHVSEFFDRKDNPNLLVIHYEDMKKDLRSVIFQISNFLGKNINEEGAEKLVDHLSFENMKKNRSVNYDSLIEHIKKFLNSEEKGSFFRKGEIGEWKKHMSSDLLERFERWEKENL